MKYYIVTQDYFDGPSAIYISKSKEEAQSYALWTRITAEMQGHLYKVWEKEMDYIDISDCIDVTPSFTNNLDFNKYYEEQRIKDEEEYEKSRN